MVEVLEKMSLPGKGWAGSAEARSFPVFIANLILEEQ